MTQKGLADVLHVTAQAVSRWETGEVEPSISTLSEMAKIFGVSVDEIIDGESAPKAKPEEEKGEKEESKPVLAVCERCNKPIYNSSEIFRITHNQGYGPHRTTTKEVLCKSCNDKRVKQLHEQQERIRNEEVMHGIKQRKRSFFWGIIITAIIAAIAIPATVSNEGTTSSIVIASVVSALFFPFISCLFLKNNFIGDMVLCVSSWSLKLPGLIFNLSLDGIIWLLTVKLLFWILGILFSIFTFILAISLGLIMGIFVYPYALIKNIKYPEDSD